MKKIYEPTDRIDFGKHKGKLLSELSPEYIRWCKDEIEGFEIKRYTYKGKYYSQDEAYKMRTTPYYDAESGTKKGYTIANSNELIPVTYHDDGGQTIHFGGPAGDLYVDEFGNT